MVTLASVAAWRATRPRLTSISFLSGVEPLADERFSELSGIGTLDRAYVIPKASPDFQREMQTELKRLGFRESFSPRGPSPHRMWENAAGDSLMTAPGIPVILDYNVDAWMYEIRPKPDTTTVIVYEFDKRPTWLIELDWRLRDLGSTLHLNPAP
ncbi:hypothetical protein EON79_13195 [bacterium]|nr:MAG: hypothetical protein EON79_13195 [bacterium]